MKERIVSLLEDNEKAELRPRSMGVDDFLRYI